MNLRTAYVLFAIAVLPQRLGAADREPENSRKRPPVVLSDQAKKLHRECLVFDGVPMVPHQLDDVSSFPNITQALLDGGYSQAAIRKIMGENTLRVLREAADVAGRLQSGNKSASRRETPAK